MNIRIRMNSAMLIIIMLCILCVNTVLARVDAEKKVLQSDVWCAVEESSQTVR